MSVAAQPGQAAEAGQLAAARRRRALEDGTAFLLLLLLTAALYGSILPAGFSHDDPVILKHVLSRSLGELVASPEAWRSYNPLYFFPEQLWSFSLDVALFGIDAGASRVRQLAGLVVAAFLLYRAVRPPCGPLAAAWGAALFLAGPVAAGLAQQLMSRHYLDGTAFILAAFLALRRHVTSESRKRWLAASSLLYLLAVLAKEVFAPFLLVAVLWLGLRRRNLPAWAMLGGALAVAVGYRFYMVGALARVYQTDIWTPAALLANATRLVRAIPESLMGPPGITSYLALGLLAIFVFAGLRSVRAGLLAAASAAAVAAPAALVAQHLDSRHLLPLWLLAAAGAALGFRRLATSRAPLLARAFALGLGAAALGLVGIANRVGWTGRLEEARAFSASWDFVFRTGTETDIYQLPPTVRGFGYSYAAASWLRENAGDGRRGPRVAGVEDAALCLLDIRPADPLFRYRAGAVEQDPAFARSLAEACPAMRRRSDLRANVSYRQERFGWDVAAPSQQGTTFLLVLQNDPSLETFAQTYGVTPRGSLWLLPDRGKLRIGFAFLSAEGWITSTVVGTLPLAEGATVDLPPA